MFERLKGDKAGPWVILGGILIAAVYLGTVGVIYSEVYESVYHEYATSETEAARKREFERECARIVVIEELRRCFNNKIKTGRETQRAQEDLYAQKQMAQWAFWMVILTGLIGVPGIGLTIAGVVLIKRNLTEARKVTAATVDAARATERSVDLMTKAERPFFVVTELKPIGFVKTFRAVRPHVHRVSEPGGRAVTVSATISNFGTRVGIIRSVHFDHCWQPPPPEQPEVKTLGEWAGKRTVAQGDLVKDILGAFVFSAEVVNEIMEYQEHLCVHGYIRYSDVHGTIWRSGFSFEYLPPHGFVEEDFFVNSSPISYWYDIEEKNENGA